MNWFKHDTDATQDARIKKLIIRYGPEGYAVYFHCLELIAAEISETNLTFELEHDAEIVADNLHFKGTATQSGRERVEEIMRFIVEIGLFQSSEGRIFCFKLLRRIDMSMTSNPRFRGLIEAAKAENHDEVMSQHDSIMQASKQASKQEEQEYNTGGGGEGLESKKKAKTPPPPPFDTDFSSFWSRYPRKDEKSKARAKYTAQRRKKIAHETIMAALENYLVKIERDNTDPQYIKYPSSFLNCLEDFKEVPPALPSRPAGPPPRVASQGRMLEMGD
jgi:hypothetical protein